MAYDAAVGTVVLFGGEGAQGRILRDTWAWDGSTWTKQTPATSPPRRADASMAYDAATGTVVLFGGINGNGLGDTWAWDGSTWTKQTPATRPPPRMDASMVYDAATRTVILFGGNGVSSLLSDTRAWDGSTWTQQHPATSPPPRDSAPMAYDAATGTVVLFGGDGNFGNFDLLSDTWAWDGSTWTQQHPATSPPPRDSAPIAYDAATGTVVLFGGQGTGPGAPLLSDTWAWGPT
jgi:Galactose oxidase, central domain